MRHIISILLQNEAGALARVAGLFSARGYNIESLTVAATDDPAVSRLTVVTLGTEAVVNQINKQVSKLIDVVDRVELTRRGHLEREVLLVKLTDVRDQAGLEELLDRSNARQIDDTDGMVVVELCAKGEAVDALLRALPNVAQVCEVVRSGAVGIARGDQLLTLRAA